MDFQSTGIKTFDNRDVTVYNSDIITQSIENYSRHPVRRLQLDIKLGYGTDFQKALKILESIIGNDPSVEKNPKYSIVFNKFDSDCYVVRLKFWVKYPSNVLAIRSAIAYKIQQMFD